MGNDWKPLVAYSTNVHRGERLTDAFRFLQEITVPVCRQVFGDAPGGLELHVGIAVARELSRPEALDAFGDFLRRNGLRLFSINAFPLLDFHSKRVKERVYRPSWAEAARSRWTNVIANLLASLLPAGTVGSISTLGGAFRPRAHSSQTLRAIARGYLRTIDHLARLDEEEGKTIVLAVEPEPCTTFETAEDVISFFQDVLVPLAVKSWRRRGLASHQSEERLRRFFTVNFDTCHFSVLFRDLRESLLSLARSGIAVGKVHVTSAVSLRDPFMAAEAYRQFRAMDEPRYFHQFAGADRAGRVKWRGFDLGELPERLVRGRNPEVAELRAHFHVPLYLKRWRRLATTREETRELVLEAARRRISSQFVVETYTWPLLSGEHQVAPGIARELRWLRQVLGEAGLPPSER